MPPPPEEAVPARQWQASTALPVNRTRVDASNRMTGPVPSPGGSAVDHRGMATHLLPGFAIGGSG